MANEPRKHIIPQMFDVRPTDRSGGLDWNRIQAVGSRRDIVNDGRSDEVTLASRSDERPGHADTYDTPCPMDGYRRIYRPLFHIDIDRSISDRVDRMTSDEPSTLIPEEDPHPFFDDSEQTYGEEVVVPENVTANEAGFRFSISSRMRETLLAVFPFRLREGAIPRGALYVAVFLFVLGGGIFSVKRLFSLKGEVLGESVTGATLAQKAVTDLESADFNASSRDFQQSYRTLSEASDSLGTVGNGLAQATGFIPGLSKISSGQGLLEGAKHLSAAGVSLSRMLTLLPVSKAGPGAFKADNLPFLDLADEAQKDSASAAADIDAARKAFDRVNPEDVPADRRDSFLSIRQKLPEMAAALDGFDKNADLVRELLGANGPRVYLFLFQNNAELRPTGGFIGSYGLLKVNNGHIGKLFVDGIFNPDGQLKENIVPPAPIQKVSAAWSLHDSNWWPDFPTSAEKATFFYEKTGGPTVDGIITLTPTVIEDLLRLTGPIDMPEYGVTIDADSFQQVVQAEVEENYDRTLNQPKKILADMAPIMFDRLFSIRSGAGLVSLADTLSRALDRKQILLYSRNADVEALVDRAGWSGRMLDTPRDYLSVVHTNLNGFKTDAVIQETIDHSAAIQADGSVLDTVRITRKHTGGNTPYDWFNRVNSDYLRVYVPEGSELISASGQTYEFPKAPLDYDALGFRRDDDVQAEEKATKVDSGGTRISEESGKTVFGNWVYVSPGESVTVEYTYRLPFKVSPQGGDPASYSALFQKQSGSLGSALHSELSVPDRLSAEWHSDGLGATKEGFSFDTTLATDAYYGAVFSAK